MEHKIGEIIASPDGRRKAEVVEDKKLVQCSGCLFGNDETCTGRACLSQFRSDHKNIIYKEIKMDTSYEKYLQEKAFLEAWGHTSVITYEEWKEIKEETK